VLDYDPQVRPHLDGQRRPPDRPGARTGRQVQWILETHVHADHLSAAPYLKRELGGQLGIGRHITTVQKVFGGLFNAETDFARDGRQFDHLFDDGETFAIGNLPARAHAHAGPHAGLHDLCQ
jgi:glyoxylase-like metal-dependent hydrolase (beta-lactamase superfamily II)